MYKLAFVTRRHTKYLDIEFSRGVSRATSEALRAAGFHYISHINSWRGDRNFEQALEIAERAVKLSKATQPCNKQTLCWGCAKSGYGSLSDCPWERSFKPVEGWEKRKPTLPRRRLAKGVS